MYTRPDKTSVNLHCITLGRMHSTVFLTFTINTDFFFPSRRTWHLFECLFWIYLFSFFFFSHSEHHNSRFRFILFIHLKTPHDHNKSPQIARHNTNLRKTIKALGIFFQNTLHNDTESKKRAIRSQSRIIVYVLCLGLTYEGLRNVK